MLVDWYFCCCIDANANKTHTYLAILGTFRDPDSDQVLLSTALQELQRTELWLQIYAFQYLLPLLTREDLSDGFRIQIKQYYLELLEHLPDEIDADIYKQLFHAIAFPSPINEIQQSVRKVAEAVQILSHRSTTRVPYLDLRLFLPETILFTIMYCQCQRSSEFRDVLMQELSDSFISPLDILLENALMKYEYGRLAFRFAAYLAVETAGSSKKQVMDRIWDDTHCNAAQEPDLLLTIADIQYLSNHNPDQSDLTVHLLINESFQMQYWQQNVNRPRKRKLRSENFPLRTMGFSLTSHSVLETLLWQLTLWGMAVQLDSITSAERLSPLWSMPREEVPKVVVAKAPKHLQGGWRSRLIHLAKLHYHSDDFIKIVVQPAFKGRGGHIDFRDFWLFFSPWLRPGPNITPGDRRLNRKKSINCYPKAAEGNIPNSAVILRLLACSVIAITLLRSLPADHDFRRVYIALIAHASDVIFNVFQPSLKAQQGSEQRTNNEFAKMLEGRPELAGLMSYTQRQINKAGRGDYETISPQDFMNVLYSGPWHKKREDLAKKNSFTRIVLPEVLMDWVANAYPGANGKKGCGRWLEHLSSLYNVFNAPGGKNKHSYIEGQKAAVLVRYLLPDESSSLIPPYLREWYYDYHYKSRTKIPSEWQVHHRKMMLTDVNLHPDDWHRPEWNDEGINSTTRLVRALERFAALQNGSLTNAPDLETHWETEWIDELYGVSDPRKMDRFIRLRLLEILDSPGLIHNPDGQELISFMLLECGSIYDLRKLFEIIYTPHPDHLGLTDVNQSRRVVRETIARAIFHETATYEQQELRLNAQDPQLTMQRQERLALLRDMLLTLTYLTQPGISQSNNDLRLNKIIRTEYKNYQTRQSRQRLGEVEATVRFSQKDTRLIIDQPVEDWAIHSAVYNPNDQKMKLLVNEYDLATTRAFNCFKMNLREIRQLLDETLKQPHILFAVVVNNYYKHKENRTFLTFNCGLPFYLTYAVERRVSDLLIGDYCTITVQKNGRRTEVIGGQCAPRKLPYLKRAQTIQEGRLKEVRFKRNQDVHQYPSLRRFKKSLEDVVDWRYWDADLSRRFRPGMPNDEKPVNMILGEDDLWRPVAGDLMAFLLNRPHLTLAGISIIAYIDDYTAKDGNSGTGWLFSSEPGTNYALYPNNFRPADAERLQGQLYSEHNAFGLLVAVVPVRENGDVLLALVDTIEGGDDDELNTAYPGLRLPFDRRNLEWSIWVSPGDGLLAERNTGSKRWFTRLPKSIPGFPGTVNIIWGANDRGGKGFRSEFTVTDWDESGWRRAELCGERVFYNQIEPQNRDRRAFVGRWLRMYDDKNKRRPIRERLRLARAISKVSDNGEITFLTDERIRVSVNAESLTMDALDYKRNIFMPEGRPARDAEIINMRWFRPKQLVCDHTEVPAKAQRKSSLKGVLFKVPHHTSDSTRCEILWQTDDVPVSSILDIGNLGALYPRPKPGSIIENNPDDPPNLQIRDYYILTNALWTTREWNSGERFDLLFLGSIGYEGGRRWIAQAKPGELVLLPTDISSFGRTRHMSHLGQDWQSQGGIPKKLKAQNIADQSKSWGKFRRAMLSWDKNRVFVPGVCEASVREPKVVIDGVRMSLHRHDHSFYSLRREFKLRKAEQRAVSHEEKAPIWKERWEDFLEEPDKPQNVVATGSNNAELIGLQVPIDDTLMKFTKRVPIGEDEREFIPYNKYVRDKALAILYQTSDNKWQASYRRVPPLPIEVFRIEELEVGFNTPVALKQKNQTLYYVGRTALDAFGNELAEPHHRFELGFGQMLLIPHSRLKFNGRPFEDSRLALYHGDLIKRVSFEYIDIPDSIGVEQKTSDLVETNCIMVIEDWAYSQATKLYYQRKANIVHVLHLTATRDHIKINYIEGLNEERIAEHQNAITEAFEYRQLRPELSAESHKYLLDRLREKDPELESMDLVVLGRLDLPSYEQDLGVRVIFDYVKMTFLPEVDQGVYSLKSGELIFMQAGKIEQKPNDMQLHLHPLEGIDPMDIGEDFNRSICILRRQFSKRINLLEQIYEDEEFGPDWFVGSQLLVWLSPPKHNERNIRAELLTNEGGRVKARYSRALQVAIAANGEGYLLAAVTKLKKTYMELEIKPGVFVRLADPQYRLIDAAIGDGAIVQVKYDEYNGQYVLARAAFSDMRYLTNQARPVVILPKNTLLRYNVVRDQSDNLKNNRFWAGDKFTIGSLPSLEAGISYREDTVQAGPLWRSAVELMQRPHPKIGYLWLERNKNLRIEPPDDRLTVGKLTTKLDSSGRQVHYESLLYDTTPKLVHWRHLTFMQASVEVVKRRAAAERWTYHDRRTGMWTTRGVEENSQQLNFDIKPLTIDANSRHQHSIWHGPLFFEWQDNELTLRYSHHNLLNYGFPVDELMKSLRRWQKKQQRNRQSSYAVAGVFSKSCSIWVELCPGRVVEMPLSLLVRRSGNRSYSLSDLEHRIFGLGDQITLEILEDDPLTIDRIVLVDWRPAGRPMLGNRAAFLPVIEANDKEGKLVLGAGRFEITLPIEDVDEFCIGKTVMLYPNNKLSLAGSQCPSKDDVVLLGLDNATKEPTIHGLPGFSPTPERQNLEVWQDSLFGEDVLSKTHSGSCYANQNGLRELIKASGGALPVTVEGLSPRDRLLFFSTRVQDNLRTLPSGKLLMGHLCGYLPHSQMVLINCNLGFVKIKIDHMISGLPANCSIDAVEELTRINKLIWLHGDEEGNIQCGLNTKHIIQPSVIPQFAIGTQNRKLQSIGLVCQTVDSKKHYWLPDHQIAWTQLNLDQIEHIFNLSKSNRFDHESFKAAVVHDNKMETPSISLTRVYSAAFERLEVGKELLVRIVSPIDSEFHALHEQAYIVRDHESQMVMRCIVSGKDGFAPGQHVVVEVTRRIFGHPPLLEVVPEGTRRYVLDLPEYMLLGEKSFEMPRPAFQDFKETLPEPVQLTLSGLTFSNLSDAELNQLLSQAYKLPLDSQDNFSFRMVVTNEWVRRNSDGRETIDLHCGLMAVLILNDHSQMIPEEIMSLGHWSLDRADKINRSRRAWSRQAVDLVRDLGRRAMRSVHVEMLYQLWFNPERGNQTRTDGFWRRLQLFKPLLQPSLKLEHIRLIEQFNRAVTLQHLSGVTCDNEIVLIAMSLALAVGQTVEQTKLLDQTEVIQDLISEYRTLPLSKIGNPPNLHQSHAFRLSRMLKRSIIPKSIDIMLLAPVPELKADRVTVDVNEIINKKPRSQPS